MKSALRDLLSVSYDMISILVISRYAAPPYPAAPDFPPSGRQNKSLYAFRRQRRYKNGAEGAVPRQRSDTI